jgi:hypothetical protein
MNRSQQQTRRFHEPEQAQNGPQSQSIHVRKQSASGFSPRQQARQRTVLIRDRATAFTGREQHLQTDTNYPQTQRTFELTTSAISPPTDIGHEPGPATNGSSRRIVASIFQQTSFPVHIRIISAYVLI